MDVLQGFIDAQRGWSEETFGLGSHRGPTGPLKHLAKEAVEAQEAVGTEHLIEELADCLFLLVDAMWRSGYTSEDLLGSAFRKLEKNKARNWGNWKDKDPNAAIEHVRS